MQGGPHDAAERRTPLDLQQAGREVGREADGDTRREVETSVQRRTAGQADRVAFATAARAGRRERDVQAPRDQPTEHDPMLAGSGAPRLIGRSLARNSPRSPPDGCVLQERDDVADLGAGAIDGADRQLEDAVGAADERDQPGPGRSPRWTETTGRPPPRSGSGWPRKTASIGKRMNIMWMPFVPVSHSPASGSSAGPAHQAHELGPQAVGDLEPVGQGRGAARDCGRAAARSRSRGPRIARTGQTFRFWTIRMIAGPRMTMNSDGKMQPTSGNSILIGALAACSSARWRRSMRSCSDWTWRTLRDRDAELLGLDDRADEVGQRHDLGPRDDVAQRVAARLADADLGQRPPELVRQRALQLLDDLAERGVEAETGADGDRQQVEGVRDHQQDGLLALLDPAARARTPGRCSRRGRRRAASGCADDEREAEQADDDEQEEEEDRADDRADRP